MKVLDLFSGIGGFSLGFNWAGFETIGFCEIEPYAQKVLRKHWPNVPIYEDVKTLNGNDFKGVDIITGGFPCQDISNAGKREGIKGERSGLWSELCRIISEARPRFAVLENVSALLHRGLSDVLRDLAQIGYDAQWHCIPASAVGAYHQRDRIWVIAYPHSATDGEQFKHEKKRGNFKGEIQERADTYSSRESQPQRLNKELRRWIKHVCKENLSNRGIWAVEPNMARMVHGIPRRVDRTRGLGNSVVPQIPYAIAMAIKDSIK